MTRFSPRAAAGLAALLSACAALGAGPPTIGLDEIRPGMTGYGLTVFAGTAVDTFGVTVVGVQPNVRVQGSLILIEVAGHGLELSSIAQGMSGSPIFLDGRLAGALAFGWGGSLKPIAGVTPIAEMFAVPAGGGEAADGARRLGAVEGLLPAADPQLAAALGLEPPAGGVSAAPLLPPGWPDAATVAAALLPASAGGVAGPASWICRPAAAGGPAAAASSPAALVPGGACAVPLVLGDALLGAVGTVTWVEDGDVWIFGHPFMQRGPVDLPLAAAEVLTVLPSRDMSFKMGAIGPVVGAVHRDQRAGLRGRIGAVAPLVPVRVTVDGGEGGHAYGFEVADDPQLLPALVFWSIYNALLAGGDDASLQTVRLRADTRWDAPGALGRDGLVITGAASGPGAAAGLGAQVMAPLRILLNNPYGAARLTGVTVEVTTAPRLSDARITGITGPARLPAAGGPVTWEVEVEPRRGARERVAVTLDVPAGLADQPYRVVAASAAELFALEGQRAAGRFDPAGMEQTVRLLDSPRDPGTLTVMVFAPGRGVVVGGQELDALPGSIARTVRRGIDKDNRTLADAVARRDTMTGWLLEGHALLDLRAGRELTPQTVEKRP